MTKSSTNGLKSTIHQKETTLAHADLAKNTRNAVATHSQINDISPITKEIMMTIDPKQKNPELPSYNDLLDCIHNLMGIFDTPMARRHINNSFAEEARQIGRTILEKTNRKTWKR